MATIGTFADILALQPQHEALLRAIRSLVLARHPDAVEVSRPGDKAVSWGWGPKKMSEAYVYALPYKNHVNLGFYKGASLSDPNGLLKGTGKQLRHMSFTHVDQLQDPGIGALLDEAKQERLSALKL